jgi:hypothetical protein
MSASCNVALVSLVTRVCVGGPTSSSSLQLAINTGPSVRSHNWPTVSRCAKGVKLTSMLLGIVAAER